MDMPKWFDFGASSVIMPNDYQKRMEKVNKYSNIDLYVLSIDDLIQLKFAAYLTRKERTLRDLTDLKSIQPTKEQLECAYNFVKTKHAPPTTAKSFIDDFKSDLDKAYVEVLKEVLNE